ncbi:MAG TPA: hypothetical protein PKN96_05755 [Flavobacterium sp.]|uniref:hypothetical protein n=1 Tax=Flavobacterium sp. TaxID=239 RepID=UPI002B907FB8|nr:hypothetical protein [Flavobacterium sp.]HNP32779.1 hypothetical protein [Flavobacterium sp.]
MENQEKKHDKISWSIFIGCMFIGMGIGAAFDKTGVGTLIGLGAGFIVSSFYESEKSK